MHKAARHPTVFPGIDAVSIQSDRTFPRHSHDEFGFGYIDDGAQDSWSGRGQVEAEAGDTITVNPAEVHDGIGRKARPRSWRMLYLSPSALAELTDTPLDRACFTRPVNTSRRVAQLTMDAINAVTGDRPDRDHAEQALILALAAHLDADGDGNDGPALSRRRSREVQTVLDLILQSWTAPLSLADFADAAHVSRFRILRMFSREMGATPHAYLTQHRIKRAKAMIEAGQSLADTAIACGFSDQSHLTRTFSRQLGLTPGRFRRPAAH